MEVETNGLCEGCGFPITHGGAGCDTGGKCEVKKVKGLRKKPKFSLLELLKAPKKKLSDDVKAGKVLISPNGEEATIQSVNRQLGLAMLTTVKVVGNYFELEVRSPRTFDVLFKDWKWKWK